MPKYHVTGTNIITGQRVDRTLTAASAADARSFLSGERVAVERLHPVDDHQPLDLARAGSNRDDPHAAQAAVNAAMLAELKRLRKRVGKGPSPLRVSLVRIAALTIVALLVLALFAL